MNITEATQACLAIMNASAIDASTYPTSSDDPAYPTAHVTAMIYAAGRDVLSTIANTPGHPRIKALLTSTDGFTNAAALPSRIGDIIACRVTFGTQGDGNYQPAEFAPFREVQDFRNEDAILTFVTNPYLFGIQGEKIYISGTFAQLDYVASPLDVTVILPPSGTATITEYENAVIAVALSYLFPVEGSNLEVGAFFDGKAREALMRVKGGADAPAPAPFTG